ncbi:TonB-dependent receptor [Echinicola sp. 20G]|uniref:SusC/RagA family TonB-linked outer membrane protein n=1 Tax=Echinicola sp. 20G TaxID=2781961 RepID=UPI001F1A722C|nr:TonB-dependent receptor [Echinicola sp. 20G]
MNLNFTYVRWEVSKWMMFAMILIFSLLCLMNTNTYGGDLKRSIKYNDESLLRKVEVTGIVKDAIGDPIIGATVLEKGTGNGAVTDMDGKYQLIVEDNAVLVFSSIGYSKQEVEVGNKTIIDVVLDTELTDLEEMVVVGYGEVKKKDLTGSVGVVEGKDIASRQTTQISQALQGAVSGVMVTRNNSGPGATSTIRVRGITTIGDNEPLIIMDGVPIRNINDVNPNDVESISVLKDAASASIYGSRAAAGVILITTKRAKEGSSQLTYNYEFGIDKPTKLPGFVSAQRYLEMANELRWNDSGNGDNEYPTYSQEMVENYYQLNADNPDLYPITDWTDLIFNASAPRQSHDLQISAGMTNIKTNISFGYDKIDAIYDHRTYERMTARINNDLTINQFISANVDLNYKRTVADQPTLNPIGRARISAPIYAALWSDGRIAEGKQGANVYAQLHEGGFNDANYHLLGGRAALHITPMEGLKISGVIAPQFGFDKAKNFLKQIAWYQYDDPTVFGGYIENHASTDLNESRNDNYQVTSQFLINYSKSFGLNNFNAVVGYENFYAFAENLGASRLQYELSSFPYLNIGPLDYRGNSGSATENAYRSYFGRLMYNYDNKYLIQANVRTDGSSRFHEDYRWGTFPSVSLGWVISQEDFLKNSAALSFMKLRASYGSLGNERIGNYPYQSTLSFSNALFYEGNSIVSATTAAQVDYALQDISWETTKSYNIGLDLGFLQDRLTAAVDVYQKTTNDMLLELYIPLNTGFESPQQNAGDMNTKGWELELGWRDTKGEFSYSVSANLSDSKSVMGNLSGTEFLGDQIKIEGSEFNEWYGYQSDGLFQTQEEVDNSATISSSTKPGDVKYRDISGPNGVPDGNISPEYDRVPLGGSLPRYLYGGIIKMDYKGIDFSAAFQGIGKQNSRVLQRMVEPLPENWGNIPAIYEESYWSLYNSDAENLSAKYPRLSRNNLSNNYAMSNFWMFNGSYFRLKNVTLGYSLPKTFTEKIKINRLRVYGSASDLFSIDKFPDGWDPESALGDYITTTYLLGLSVTF